MQQLKKVTLTREADGRYRIDFPNSFEMPHAVVFEMRRGKAEITSQRY